MIQLNQHKSFIKKVLALMVLTTVMQTGIFRALAQEQAGIVSDESKSNLQIGTYDPEEALQAHPAQTKLQEALSKAQNQMQEAQQEGDQQKIQQIQQQYEQTHNKLMEEFKEDVTEAMPAAAKSAGVKVGAFGVIYRTTDVQTKDITSQLIKAFDNKLESTLTDESEEAEVSVQIGTFNSERTLQTHPVQAELQKALSKAQNQMQEAQQEGDQQKMQQIQQQYEQTHDKLIEKFEQDVGEAMPAAAEEADVKVVALEVLYKAAGVQTKDITFEVIKIINENIQ